MKNYYELPGSQSDGLDARLKEWGNKERVEVLKPSSTQSNVMVPANLIIPKSLAHECELRHPVVVLVLYRLQNDMIEVLMQQRGRNVGLLPLARDFGVTGHIRAGEKKEEAVLREGDEEINLTGVREEDLQHLRDVGLVFQKGNKLIRHYAHYLFLELKPGISFEPSEDVEILKRWRENEIFETLDLEPGALVPFEQIQAGHRFFVFNTIKNQLEKTTGRVELQKDTTHEQDIILVA